ncbi:hypothetical protein PR048_032546 [Dryococelus australis]|uniref:Uncharacterized protein n=1 Tax=Dryococelus australis TaxID=614101 RepID=A0ABQ9G2H7_9NEOP|nr:hypothetical protein PR048_032546 [Dryococelus australis]
MLSEGNGQYCQQAADISGFTGSGSYWKAGTVRWKRHSFRCLLFLPEEALPVLRRRYLPKQLPRPPGGGRDLYDGPPLNLVRAPTPTRPRDEIQFRLAITGMMYFRRKLDGWAAFGSTRTNSAIFGSTQVVLRSRRLRVSKYTETNMRGWLARVAEGFLLAELPTGASKTRRVQQPACVPTGDSSHGLQDRGRLSSRGRQTNPAPHWYSRHAWMRRGGRHTNPRRRLPIDVQRIAVTSSRVKQIQTCDVRATTFYRTGNGVAPENVTFREYSVSIVEADVYKCVLMCVCVLSAGAELDCRQWVAVCGLLVVAAALGVGVGVPLALELRSSRLLEARLQVVRRILREVPLVDGSVPIHSTTFYAYTTPLTNIAKFSLPQTKPFLRSCFLCNKTFTTTGSACISNSACIWNTAADSTCGWLFKQLLVSPQDCATRDCETRGLIISPVSFEMQVNPKVDMKDVLSHVRIPSILFYLVELIRNTACVDCPSTGNSSRLGVAVAERLARPPPNQGEPGSIPGRVTGFSHVGAVPDDAAGRRDLPFPPPLHSGAAPYSPESPAAALKTSLLRVVQISSLVHSSRLIICLGKSSFEQDIPRYLLSVIGWFGKRMNKVIRPMAMLILHFVEQYTNCIQVNLMQGFQMCPFELPITAMLSIVALWNRLPHKVNRVRFPAGSLPDMWESWRTMPLMGGFSRGPPASPALVFCRCSIHFTLIGSQDLDLVFKPGRRVPTSKVSTYEIPSNQVNIKVQQPTRPQWGWGAEGQLPERAVRRERIATRYRAKLSVARSAASCAKAKRVRFPVGSLPDSRTCQRGFLGHLLFLPPSLHSGRCSIDRDRKISRVQIVFQLIGKLWFVVVCNKVSLVRRERLESGVRLASSGHVTELHQQTTNITCQIYVDTANKLMNECDAKGSALVDVHRNPFGNALIPGFKCCNNIIVRYALYLSCNRWTTRYVLDNVGINCSRQRGVGNSTNQISHKQDWALMPFCVQHKSQTSFSGQHKLLVGIGKFREFSDLYARLLSHMHTEASAGCSLAVVSHLAVMGFARCYLANLLLAQRRAGASAPINEQFTTVRTNHAQLIPKGLGFSSMQQPMEKRRRLRDAVSCCVKRTSLNPLPSQRRVCRPPWLKRFRDTNPLAIPADGGRVR